VVRIIIKFWILYFIAPAMHRTMCHMTSLNFLSTPVSPENFFTPTWLVWYDQFYYFIYLFTHNILAFTLSTFFHHSFFTSLFPLLKLCKTLTIHEIFKYFQLTILTLFFNKNFRIHICFLFINFRAYSNHFSQRKSTFIIKWKLFNESETTWISIFMKVQPVHLELFAFFIMILTHEFYFFPFPNFRACFKHFGQRKLTFIINWKLFRGSKTTCILIFIKIQSVYLELFTIFVIF